MNSIIVPIHKKGDKTDCNNYRGHNNFAKHLQNFIQHPALKVNSSKQRKLSGIINVAFEATVRLLIIYSAFAKYLRENGNTMN